ncbi:MAG: threonine synthase [Pseudomonadota bacterium]
MQYISTRGTAPELGFSDTVLSGLARDGGLYVPRDWPQLSPSKIAAMRGAPYSDVAFQVLKPFVNGEITDIALERMINEAYATFRHPAVAPLVQIDPSHFILELFHGPTLAFKDVAMQLLARLMDHILTERGERATIVGATSGDTGGAAIDAFKDCERVDIFILYPQGRVSEVQRRQMTTVGGNSVHAVAVDGNFDDCQALVKAMFNDFTFRDRVRLSGVNSINWGRIMAQAVYYFTAAVALGSPDRKVSFSVPTGNFGDVLAGYVAKRMGLPIDRLVVATNCNDILRRALHSGRYETQGVEKTQSPSMDIQVSSNFERLLFDAQDRAADDVVRQMETLKQSGAFTIPGGALTRITGEFDAATVDENETATIMADLQVKAGYGADPHTAVGFGAAEATRKGRDVPMVTLATAHPAKFPDAVASATGIHPALPDSLGDLYDREERFSHVPNDLDAIEALILDNARISKLEKTA